jgi:hypothetical protein
MKVVGAGKDMKNNLRAAFTKLARRATQEVLSLLYSTEFASVPPVC